MCPSAPRHRAVWICSLPGWEHSKNWPVFPWHQACSPQQRPSARFGPEAGMPWPSPCHQNRTAAPWPLQSAPLPHRGGWWLAGTLYLGWEASNSAGLGAVQPEGNYLEIPSWALSTTAHFTTDAAKPLTSLPRLLAFLSHSLPQSNCFMPSAR